MKIPGVRVEQPQLTFRRFDNLGVTMTDVRNVVEGVKESTSTLVVQILHPTPHHLNGVPICEAQVAANVNVSLLGCVVIPVRIA